MDHSPLLEYVQQDPIISSFQQQLYLNCDSNDQENRQNKSCQTDLVQKYSQGTQVITPVLPKTEFATQTDATIKDFNVIYVNIGDIEQVPQEDQQSAEVEQALPMQNDPVPAAEYVCNVASCGCKKIFTNYKSFTQHQRDKNNIFLAKFKYTICNESFT